MSSHTPAASRALRADIQMLRGVAVLSVLVYHAHLGLLGAGYLGVDVFYVISGFLITSLLRDGIARGDFRLYDFYFRRIRRLLPAAYVTFFVTLLLAPLLLTSPEMEDFRDQLVGAVTFTANIALFHQTGYFEGAADLKPLLHTWSLSIEEQYYFVLPALLMLLPRRAWALTVLAVLAASLACAMLWREQASMMFYLLPYRAWELMIGSLGALGLRQAWLTGFWRLAFWPALAVLLGLPWVGWHVDGFDAGVLLVCLATLVLLRREHPLLAVPGRMPWLVRTGDISYSLYLVHWPLFAYFNNYWISGGRMTEVLWRLALLVLSFGLGWLLHQQVEQRVLKRPLRSRQRFIALMMICSAGLVALASGLTRVHASAVDYDDIRRVNSGIAQACDFKAEFKPIAECRTARRPRLMVWGDSYAMHLVPGLMVDDDDNPVPLQQATRSTCAPLLGVAVIDDARNSEWARSCMRFNDSVLAALAKAPSVRVVVLSSPFDYLLNPQNRLLVRDAQGRHRVLAPDPAQVQAGLARTVQAIRALGKRVVLVAPPPTQGFDIGRCLERIDSGLVTHSDRPGCEVDVAAYHLYRAPVLSLLAALPAALDLPVIRFDDFLCSASSCRTRIDGEFLYRDSGHLAPYGSRYLAGEMGLLARVKAEAR